MERLIQALEHRHRELMTLEDYSASCTQASLLLRSINGNALAQVLSFVSDMPAMTVAAVSPRARVYAEAVGRPYSNLYLSIRLSGHGLYHTLGTPGESPYLPAALAYTTWWLQKSGVPLEAYGLAALRSVLAESHEVTARLASVHLEVEDEDETEVTASVLRQLVEIAANDVTGLLRHAVPSEMRLLRVLYIRDCSEATFHVARKFPSLTTLDLTGLKQAALNMADVVSAATLTRLALSDSSVACLLGCERCTALTEFEAYRCAQLTSLSPLSCVTPLRIVNVAWSGVRSLDGLGGCRALELVDVCGCTDLESLSPLGGAPSLRRINAWQSGARSVDGLAACPALEMVDLRSCQRLASVADLARAPKLQLVVLPSSTVEGHDAFASTVAILV